MLTRQCYLIDTRNSKVAENLARLVERAAYACGLHVPDKILGSTSKIPKTASFNYSIMQGNIKVGEFRYRLNDGDSEGRLDLSGAPQNIYDRLMSLLKPYQKILKSVS